MASAGLQRSMSPEKEGGDTSSHMSDFWDSDAAMMGPWPPLHCSLFLTLLALLSLRERRVAATLLAVGLAVTLKDEVRITRRFLLVRTGSARGREAARFDPATRPGHMTCCAWRAVESGLKMTVKATTSSPRERDPAG